MRLYVVCPNTKRRILLSLNVEGKSQIEEIFTVECPYDREIHEYRRENVHAEPTLGASIGGAVIGGIIGAVLAGPIGAILGGGAGLLTGSSAEQEELRRVRRFSEE